MKNKLLNQLRSLVNPAEQNIPKWITYALCGLAVAAAMLLPPRYAFVLLPAVVIALAYELPKRTWKRRTSFAAVALSGLLVASPEPAHATGWPVFDLASFAQLGKIWASDASTLTKITQEVQLATKIYSTEYQKYQLAMLMAQAIKSKNLYAMQGAITMGNSYVKDHYGETAGWSKALNAGTSIPLAYSRATLPISLNTSFLAAEKLGSSLHLTQLARVGITDDTAQRTMSAAAQITQQQSLNASAVKQWESSVTSTNPNLNTAAAQQNLTNLGMVQMYEQGRANLSLNSLLAQQIAIQNMTTRDAAVQDLNRWQQLQDYAATEPTMWGSASQARANSPW